MSVDFNLKSCGEKTMDIYLYLLFVSDCHVLINKTATVCQHHATKGSYL